MTDREPFLQLIERRTLIDNRFSQPQRIDSNGGGGVFSLIFKATDTTRNCPVVLKFMIPMSNAYRLACFERESQVLSQFAGQRDIIELVAPQGEIVEELTASGIKIPISLKYYAVELAACDVRKKIDSNTWNTQNKLLCFRAMCRAVQRLHTNGIAHRDLKPGNFLVMLDGSVKMSDLGTARDVAGAPSLLPSYASPPGDIRYTPPEMIALLHDEMPEIALRADFFSLGAILFELITGAVLGPIVFSRQYLNDLLTHMGAVPTGRRKHTFDQLVPSIANTNKLPHLRNYGSNTEASVLEQLDELYRSLSMLDYRSRLRDFNRIFWKIESCLLVLRNEEKYNRSRLAKGTK